MIGRRRSGVEDAPDDLDSIWATDSIPIDDGPTEFDWSTSAAEPDPATTATEVPNRRGKVIGAGIAAALLLAVGAIVVWPRGDQAADEADDTPDATPTTLSTLPESEVTTIPEAEFEIIDPDLAPSTVPTTETSPGALDPELGAGEERPSSIELPVELAASTTPTEVVVATSEGLVTLSIPSGRVRYDDGLPTRFGGGTMVVAPDAAALLDGNDLHIFQRDGMLLEIDDVAGNTGGFLRGWTVADDGTTRFQMISYGESGDGVELEIDVFGTVTPTTGSGTDLAYDFVRSSGGRILNDTGGVYRIGDDGAAVRVSTGRAFAANGSHVLARECDDARVCELVVLDLDSGERRVVPTDEVELDNLYSLDLAPDGTAVAVDRDGDDGVSGFVKEIIDFDLGVVGSMPGSPMFTSGSSWTADGGGVIGRRRGGGGLVYLDRETGTTADFGVDLFDNIVDFGVRYPDAELPPQSSDPAARAITLSEAVTVPTGLDLVVLGEGDRMAHVDLDGRTATPWSVPDLGAGFPEIHVNGPQVTVAAASTGFTSVLGEATQIDTDGTPLPGAPRFTGPLAGTVWAPTDDAAAGIDHRLVVIGQLPAIDGPELSVPNATLLGSDGDGGLLASIGGDIFAVTTKASSRLTSGELLALNGNVVLERVCPEALACAVYLVDRTTGNSTSISASPIDDAVPHRPERLVPVAGTISPDATAVVIETSDPSAATPWAVVDLRSQTVTSLPPPDLRQPMLWNELGTYLAFLSEGNLYVYDRTNARVSRVQGLGSARAIAAVGDDFVAE
ncbi:beta-propeller domain-containing protein [Ilumatobacter coccineus]|nr:hypothetical protein [Ilumatobacter coccineus]